MNLNQCLAWIAEAKTPQAASGRYGQCIQRIRTTIPPDPVVPFALKLQLSETLGIIRQRKIKTMKDLRS
jgi:hypothetical protein